MCDLRSGEKTRTLRIATGLHALALSPNGRIAAVGIDGGIQLVDLASGEVRTTTGSLSGRPTWLLFSPDGDTVVSTNLDGTVTLWDVESAAPTRRSAATRTRVQQPVFSPDEADPLHGEPRRKRYRLGHDGRAWARTVVQVHQRPQVERSPRSPPRTTKATRGRSAPTAGSSRSASRTGASRSWTRASSRRSVVPLLGTGGEVKSLAFSPDGRTLAASAFGGVVTLWDVGSRSRLRHSEESIDDRLPLSFGLASTSAPTERRSP